MLWVFYVKAVKSVFTWSLFTWWFLNRTLSIHVKFVFYQPSKIIYISSFSVQEQKCEAQIDAATRSLFTNLFLFAVFIISNILFLWVKKDNRPYSIAMMFTPLKGALPIFSTIGNFGTVKFVIIEYYTYFKQVFAKARNWW